jgi:hypothetical protein
MDSKTARIRALNDELRQNFAEGIAVMTIPLRGPSVQLATRRDAGMPHQCGANFSGSFICSGGVSQHGGVRQNSRLPIYSDSQSPVAARPGTLSIKADNRRLLAAADIIETADLGPVFS